MLQDFFREILHVFQLAGSTFEERDFIIYAKTRGNEFKSFVNYNFGHIYYDFYFQRIEPNSK